MGVTKKPAVVAKTARKVRVSASEAAFAKASGITLEEFAKSKLPKRGRPKGSKNKAKIVDGHARQEAAKRLVELGGSLSSDGWVPGNPVDWEKLARQLQEALAAQIKENETLEFILNEYKSVIRLDSSFTFLDRLAFLFTGKIDGNKSV